VRAKVDVQLKNVHHETYSNDDRRNDPRVDRINEESSRSRSWTGGCYPTRESLADVQRQDVRPAKGRKDGKVNEGGQVAADRTSEGDEKK